MYPSAVSLKSLFLSFSQNGLLNISASGDLVHSYEEGGSSTVITDRMERARLIRNLIRTQRQREPSTSSPQPLEVALGSGGVTAGGRPIVRLVNGNDVDDADGDDYANGNVGRGGSSASGRRGYDEYVVEPGDTNDIAEPAERQPASVGPQEGDLRLVGGRHEKEGRFINFKTYLF
jgi:hypothetical protein